MASFNSFSQKREKPCVSDGLIFPEIYCFASPSFLHEDGTFSKSFPSPDLRCPQEKLLEICKVVRFVFPFTRFKTFAFQAKSFSAKFWV